MEKNINTFNNVDEQELEKSEKKSGRHIFEPKKKMEPFHTRFFF